MLPQYTTAPQSPSLQPTPLATPVRVGVGIDTSRYGH
jgi:hypothetical protein